MEIVQEALQRDKLGNAWREIEVLRSYLDSGQFLQDYEADERGEFPADLRRGVLSQDALYDLLCKIDQMERES